MMQSMAGQMALEPEPQSTVNFVVSHVSTQLASMSTL